MLLNSAGNGLQEGFSLVELSIVLVILGLLVGGIMTGQNLIKAAEIRSVTTELRQYQTAVNLFKEKYFALPGDMRNAGQFWGMADTSASGECGNPRTDTGTGTETCNGNGDGVIPHPNGDAQNYEQFRFWQHLANAGLITGEFTGVQGPSHSTHHVMGENHPIAKYSNGGWSARSDFNHAGTPQAFAYDYRHLFFIGAPTATRMPIGPLFTAEEVWNIDTKVDDGMPAKGIVILSYWDECSTAADEFGLDAGGEDAVYSLQNTDVACASTSPTRFNRPFSVPPQSGRRVPGFAKH